MAKQNNNAETAMLMNLDYEGAAIRVAGTCERPEWVAVDVCKVLGVRNWRQVLSRFKDSERSAVTISDAIGRPQETLTVTEPGLYRLIFKSRKPEAERFREWLTHEVLPCIRKHGCYPEPAVQVGSNAVVVMDSEYWYLMGRTIHEACFTATEPIRKEVGEIKDEVQELSHRVGLIEKRKQLTVKTQRMHLYVVKNYYGGGCPCCRKKLIVNSGGVRLSDCQFDHWDRPSEPGISKTWAVCAGCNSMLRDADWKNEKRPHFESYQQFRRECERAIAGPYLLDVEEPQ